MNAIVTNVYENHSPNGLDDPISYFFPYTERQLKLKSLVHLSVEDFIKTIYLAVLKRPVDSEGLTYYSDLLTNNHITPEAFIITLANSDEAIALIQKGLFDVSYYIFLHLEPLQQLAKHSNLLGITDHTSQQFNQLYETQLALMTKIDNLSEQFGYNPSSEKPTISSTLPVPALSPPLKPLKILIDMQGLQGASRERGIGRYTLGLVEALIEQQDIYQVYLLLNTHYLDMIEIIKSKFSSSLTEEQFILWSPVGDPATQLQDRLASEKIYEQTVIRFNPDCFLISNMFESHGYSNNIITKVDLIKKTNILVACILYDLIPLIHPESCLGSKKVKDWYFDKLEYLTKVDLLLTISASAQQEGFNYLDIPRENIKNISSAVASTQYTRLNTNSPILSATKEKFHLQKSFIMHTAGGDERKNVKGLIQGYALLPHNIQSNYDLVVVFDVSDAERAVFFQLARQLGIEKQLKLTGFVTHEELVALYNLADLFVFPSLHEGFGLPVLEAMLCGCPAITSNTSSLPEVIGDTQYTFNPYSPQSIADKITAILSNQTIYEELKNHCQKQTQKFSWDNTALLAFEAIHTAIRKRRLTKHLYLDISEIIKVDARSGIQRVVKALINELVFKPIEGYITYLVYIDENFDYRIANQFTYQLLGIDDNVTENTIVNFRREDILYLIDFAPELQAKMIACYKQLRQQGTQVITLVHDLIPLLHPEWWSDTREGKQIAARNFDRWLTTIREGNGVICVSKNTQQWFERWLLENSIEIAPRDFFTAVANNGADQQFNFATFGLPADYIQLQQQLIAAPTFIMVGTIEPRKGHQTVLTTFEKLWQQNLQYNLVIVGKQGWLVDDLIDKIQTHSQLNHRLFFFSGISDEFLNNLYELSTALIAASYEEGFGLPLIEAASHNLPVIARDIPVFREVGGDSVIYFNHDTLTLEKVIQNFSSYQVMKPMTWLTWQQSVSQHTQILLGNDRDYHTIDTKISFWANNARIQSYVGDIDLMGLKTTQHAGVLIFGPYIHLPQGKWQLDIHFDKCETLKFLLIIHYKLGKAVLFSQNFDFNSPNVQETISLEFIAHASIEDLEIFIEVEDTADFVINSMSLSPLAYKIPDDDTTSSTQTSLVTANLETYPNAGPSEPSSNFTVKPVLQDVATLFETFLGRQIESEEIATSLINSNKTLLELASSVVKSEEYQQKIINNFVIKNAELQTQTTLRLKPTVEDVELLFKRFLHRLVDSPEVALSIATEHQNTLDLVSTIVNSNEYTQRAVQNYFANNVKNRIDTLAVLPKIILFGAYGNGNLGDAIQANAVADIFIKQGYQPHEIAAISWIHIDDYEFIGVKLSAEHIWSFELLASADMLVIGGGGLFGINHYPLSEKNWVDSLVKFKVRYAIFGVGASAFLLSKGYQAVHEKLLHHAVFASARDAISLERMQSLEPTSHYMLDPVLYTMLKNIPLTQYSTKEANSIAVVLKYPGNESDRQFIEAYKRIAQDNPAYKTLFLEKNHPGEIEIIKQFPNALIPTNEYEILDMLKEVKYCVSMRYHGAILGLVAGCITFGLSQPKIHNLFKQIGIDEHYYYQPEMDLIKYIEEQHFPTNLPVDFTNILKYSDNNLVKLLQYLPISIS